MSNPTEKYKKLGINEALSRFFRYPIVCKELNFILRSAYGKVPKNLQTLIFEDTIAAFRLLPQMQTESVVAAAHLLLQSAEAALPKQKRNLAVTEFKQAKIALKRRCKARQEDREPCKLPQDVLVHIFSFVDFLSLVSAGQVCWSWCLAANDNRLWKIQYTILFGGSDDSSKTNTVTQTNYDWREAFRRSYIGDLSKKLTSNRGYCAYCKTIVWLHSLKCSNKQNFQAHQIKPVSPHQVVEYLLDDYFMSVASSDSDSESDDRSNSRLWAIPRNMSS